MRSRSSVRRKKQTFARSNVPWAGSCRASPCRASTTGSVRRSGSRFRSVSVSPRFARDAPRSESGRKRRLSAVRRLRTRGTRSRVPHSPRQSHTRRRRRNRTLLRPQPSLKGRRQRRGRQKTADENMCGVPGLPLGRQMMARGATAISLVTRARVRRLTSPIRRLPSRSRMQVTASVADGGVAAVVAEMGRARARAATPNAYARAGPTSQRTVARATTSFASSRTVA